jgi:hypothetical protein
MAAVTAAVGIGLAVVGGATSIYGASQKNDANADAIAAQQKALAIQQRANEIDGMRKKRQFIREGIISRATALSTATNQGAGNSSSLFGAYGQIQGRTAWGIGGVNNALATSNQLYGANQELFQAKLAANEADMISQIGSGISSLGGALIGNSSAIGNIFGNSRGPSLGTSLVDNSGRLYNSGAGAPYG